MEERLQKILAAAGYGSRRASEELIRQGRVTVNGRVAELGQKADPTRDAIALDGKRLTLAQEPLYVAVHKPRGVLSAMEDERGRRTVRELVELSGHLFEVGRLDWNSEGLMLLTNDGALAHRLTHPRYEHTKEYHVCVEGSPEEGTVAHWARGVFLDGRRTAPAEVSVLRQERDRTWLRVVMREGRKRQIRRVAALLGHPVHRLVRVGIGPLRLGRLQPGEWRHLTPEEVAALRAVADVQDVGPARGTSVKASRTREGGQARSPRKPGRADVGRRKSGREGGRS